MPITAVITSPATIGPVDPLVFQITPDALPSSLTATATLVGVGAEVIWNGTAPGSGYTGALVENAGVRTYTVYRTAGWPFGSLSLAVTATAPLSLHTVNANSIVLWQLQGNQTDSSGNGLDAVLFAGSAVYETIGAVQAFTFTNQALAAPSTPLLRIVGEYTVEWLMIPRDNTHSFFYYTCATPRVGVGPTVQIFDAYWNVATGKQGYFDSANNTNRDLPGTTLGNFGAINHFAERRKFVSTGVYQIDFFWNGTKIGAGLTTGQNVSTGNEIFRWGNYQGLDTAFLKGAVASIHVQNYARADADILADANATLGLASVAGAFTVAVATPPVPPSGGFGGTGFATGLGTTGIGEPLGNGLVRPFTRTERQDFAISAGVPLVMSCIGQVLGTPLGTLPWEPRFGSLLYRLRHRSQDPTFLDLVRIYSADAINRWEPRAQVTDVQIVQSSSYGRANVGQNNVVDIAVTVRIGNKAFSVMTKV